MDADSILMFPLWYVVFLLSVTCHEAAHAFVAYRGGDQTAYLGGQVSLNPVPHVRRELIGTVLFPLLSYYFVGWMMGWASAPYDPHWEQRHPRRAAWMALAGPVANLLLALLAFGLLRWGLLVDVWHQPYETTFDRIVTVSDDSAGLWDGAGRLLSVMLTLNVVLFILNLFPFPPMDGASVLAGFSRRFRDLRDRFFAAPMSGLIGLLIAWYLFRMVFPTFYGFVLFGLYRGA